MKQLALPFAERQDYAAEDFCPAPSNAMARDWLAHPQAWSHGRLVLWGEAGCGKTHLLHIWAAANQALLLNGATLQGQWHPTQPVVVDDSDIVPDPCVLLHLLNEAAAAAQPVLLASRLRAAQSVEIRAPEDALLEMLLMRLAAARQLALGITVQNFLLTRLPRTAAHMREAIARLDHAALDRGIRITRQTAAEILADLILG